MRTIKLFLLVLSLIQTPASLAGGNSGVGNIEWIYQRSLDGLLAVKKAGGDWSNPDNCASSDRIVLTKDNPSRSEFYSALLSSKMANKEINAWLSGCVNWNGITYPVISGLYTY